MVSVVTSLSAEPSQSQGPIHRSTKCSSKITSRTDLGLVVLYIQWYWGLLLEV